MIDPKYYKRLGVPVGASEQRIKAAYRKKVKQVHPDLNPGKGTEAVFLELHEAYEILLGKRKAPRSYAESNGEEAGEEYKRGRQTFKSKEEYDAYVEEAKAKVEELMKERRRQVLADFERLKNGRIYKLLKIMRWVYLGVVLCFLIDFIGASDYQPYSMVKYRFLNNTTEIQVVHLDKKELKTVHLDIGDGMQLLAGNDYLMRISPLLGSPTQIKSEAAGRPDVYVLGVYRLLEFWVLLFGLPFIIPYFERPKPAFYFFIHVGLLIPFATLLGIAIYISIFA